MPAHNQLANTLPEPSAEENAHSERVSALIRDEIARDGSIPFSRFMELVLYAPGLGYYTAGKQKFGAAGDFVTAPEAYPVFGRCLARTATDVLGQLGGRAILEVGAGSGRLAATMLTELAERSALPEAYYILELSPDLRERQAATIEEMVPEHIGCVRWLDGLPERGFRGLVLANELLDALPVERFKIGTDGITQLGVTWREGCFHWVELPAPQAITDRVEPLNLVPGYVSEIGLAAEAWVRSIGERIAAGMLLLIDYGFPRAEFYHPDRTAGTLMCHFRHRAHPDPLILAGLQDITAHIDFTAMAQAGVEVGLSLLGYTSQAAFLIESGLDDIVRASNPNDVRAHLSLTEQIKKLTLPHEMGELFKVIALGRGENVKVRGFEQQDRRNRL
jgi:SAM-dependent MidA family methyltransferase